MIIGSDESVGKPKRSGGISFAGLDSALALPDEPRVLSELDAYILLMQKVPMLKPLAWLMGLSLVRPALSAWYHRAVHKRLKREGRL